MLKLAVVSSPFLSLGLSQHSADSRTYGRGVLAPPVSPLFVELRVLLSLGLCPCSIFVPATAESYGGILLPGESASVSCPSLLVQRNLLLMEVSARRWVRCQIDIRGSAGLLFIEIVH